MSELESGFHLSDALAFVRRRSAIVLAGIVVGLVLGGLVYASSPTRYSATARVDISSPDQGSRTPSDAKNERGTEADLVKSDAVGRAVIAKLGLDTDPRGLFSPLTVTTKDTSDVIGLTYEAGSATVARDRVNAIARAYLDQRRATALKARDAQVAVLDDKIDTARQTQSSAAAAVKEATAGSPERIEAQSAYQQAVTDLADLNRRRDDLQNGSLVTGNLVREAPLPDAVVSKMAIAKGVGVFGLCTLAGLGAAVLVDRRDRLGGGRRRVQQLAPNANLRVLPSATNPKASPAEIDAAIDRLAVELAGGGSRGRASTVLVVGTRIEPPVALAEELASSLTFAGVPALFVLAGSSDRELRQAQVVTSFADLITAPSITGPVSLPEVAGRETVASVPTVTWLRPRGSAESSGLLRRAVVDALVMRAAREGFEVVVFVAATPTRNAAAAALGQWVGKTAVIVDDDDSSTVETTVQALQEADIDIDEVVWT